MAVIEFRGNQYEVNQVVDPLRYVVLLLSATAGASNIDLLGMIEEALGKNLQTGSLRLITYQTFSAAENQLDELGRRLLPELQVPLSEIPLDDLLPVLTQVVLALVDAHGEKKAAQAVPEPAAEPEPSADLEPAVV
jgi:hypothetical protein